MRLAENTGRKNYAKNRHLCTITQLCWAISSQLSHLLTIGKNLLNSNISSRSRYNMANFGPLTAEIGSGVWSTPAHFNRFRVMASLLQRGRSTDINQILYDVWPSPRLVHHIYIVYQNIHLRVWPPHERQPKFATCYKEWKYRTSTEGATYIWLGDHHVGHRSTF